MLTTFNTVLADMRVGFRLRTMWIAMPRVWMVELAKTARHREWFRRIGKVALPNVMSTPSCLSLADVRERSGGGMVIEYHCKTNNWRKWRPRGRRVEHRTREGLKRAKECIMSFCIDFRSRESKWPVATGQ